MSVILGFILLIAFVGIPTFLICKFALFLTRWVLHGRSPVKPWSVAPWDALRYRPAPEHLDAAWREIATIEEQAGLHRVAPPVAAPTPDAIEVYTTDQPLLDEIRMPRLYSRKVWLDDGPCIEWLGPHSIGKPLGAISALRWVDNGMTVTAAATLGRRIAVTVSVQTTRGRPRRETFVLSDRPETGRRVPCPPRLQNYVLGVFAAAEAAETARVSRERLNTAEARLDALVRGDQPRLPTRRSV